LEENVQDIDEWRKACAMLPITVAELLEWKRLQNGLLRDLRDDMKVLMTFYHERQGINKWWKAAASMVTLAGVLAVVELAMKLFTSI
jgi:UDP-N-acetylglucosamine:LPS N-acetylglucosamine transferase